MPTFTAIALDRLLEPAAHRSPAPTPKPSPLPPLRRRSPSPALYATPEITPLPDSPSSFHPSPYIVDHKRRGPRLLKSLSHNDVPTAPLPLPLDPEPKRPAAEVVNIKIEEVDDCKDDGVDGRKEPAEAAGVEKGKDDYDNDDDEDDDDDDDDFFDLRETMSTVSNDSGIEGWCKASTPKGEFFDAVDDITSEGTTHLFSRHVEEELREMRLNVLMEIERREQAEETLENLQRQWKRLSHQLSHIGLMLPDPSTITEEQDGQSNHDPAEELCKQVVITRFVASSIGRGSSRAEIELEMEPLIESKNFEIARLWDRLHYYEAANREMSQRNQEAVELARQQRHKRRRRQKWFWGSVGLTVSLGAAAFAWSYLPHSRPPSSHESDTADSNGN